MMNARSINVIIPALNEELAIPRVLAAIPTWIDRVIVVDNGSTDQTARIAADRGAHVVSEPRRGYGAACLAGIAAIDRADIVVFLDGDGSDDTSVMHALVAPIAAGDMDMVIGSRVLGGAEPGSLTLPQRFGNRLACTLMRWGFGARHTDLGPFRAVSWPALRRMAMSDTTYGWTVQMQIRAARLGLRVAETPVPYRKRIGQSKISGTIRGVIGAGTKILGTLAVERFRHAFATPLDATRRRLLVFARYPAAGATKTRLIPALGPDGAARLHAHMIRRTLHTARRTHGIGVEVHHDGGSADDWRTLLRSEEKRTPQEKGDLGDRLRSAFQRSFRRGDEAVVVIGTDCPFLQRRDLLAAFEQLREHDMVVGPAADGGYYLLGLRRCEPRVFEGIDWGGERVLAQTLARAADAGLRVSQLRTLRDIDTPADLGAFAPANATAGRPHFSVVIAAHNVEAHIAAAIASARDRHDAQVIVVDGGSTDRTREIAAAMGAEVLTSPPIRAAQMNLGAAAATGETIVFLCGDATLPPGYAAMVRAALRKPGIATGAFRPGDENPQRTHRTIKAMTSSQSRVPSLLLVDQALFVRRKVWQCTGGFI